MVINCGNVCTHNNRLRNYIHMMSGRPYLRVCPCNKFLAAYLHCIIPCLTIVAIVPISRYLSKKKLDLHQMSLQIHKKIAAPARSVSHMAYLLVLGRCLTLPVLFAIELDTFIAPAPPSRDKMPSEHLKSTIALGVGNESFYDFLQTRLA